MATTREHQQIVETPTEARQAEPGPSVLALLTVWPGLPSWSSAWSGSRFSGSEWADEPDA